MPMFQPKTVTVEARQYKGTEKCRDQMTLWRGDGFTYLENVDGRDWFEVATEDDNGYMDKGDWLIRYTEEDGTVLWQVLDDEDFQDNWVLI